MANISGSVYGRKAAPVPPSPLGISLTSQFACLVRVVDIGVQAVVIGLGVAGGHRLRRDRQAAGDGGVPAAIIRYGINAMQHYGP
jgi:hypothetical protein